MRRTVSYTADGAIGRVTFRRPESMNSLDDEVMADLFDALREANGDRSTRVLIISGEGEHFCAGGDPSWEAEFDPDGVPAAMRLASYVSNELRSSPKPVLGAVRGYCIGGGNELNLHLDATIASDTAMFAQPETRWGILPFWNTPQLLPSIVGERAAREVLLFGRMYDADQALELGLVNAVVPDAMLEDEADRWAEELLERSPTALAMVKVALNGATSPTGAAFDHQAAMVGLASGSVRYREELMSFYSAKGNRRPRAAPPRRVR